MLALCFSSLARREWQENPYEAADNPQELGSHQPFGVGKAEATTVLDSMQHANVEQLVHTCAGKLYIMCVITGISTCCGYGCC